MSIGHFAVDTKTSGAPTDTTAGMKFRNMATLPGTHQTYIGYFETNQKAKSWQRQPFSCERQRGGDVISCTKQRNKLTKGELSQWNHLPEGGNRLTAGKRKRNDFEQSCRGCRLGALQESRRSFICYCVIPTGWIMEGCQRNWAVE